MRLENRDRRDSSLLLSSTEALASRPHDPGNIRPNRRYRLRWWVRGESIDSDGTGPIMMMFVMSQHDGQWERTNTAGHGPFPTGTVAWQRREFTFITLQRGRRLHSGQADGGMVLPPGLRGKYPQGA